MKKTDKKKIIELFMGLVRGQTPPEGRWITQKYRRKWNMQE